MYYIIFTLSFEDFIFCLNVNKNCLIILFILCALQNIDCIIDSNSLQQTRISRKRTFHIDFIKVIIRRTTFIQIIVLSYIGNLIQIWLNIIGSKWI